LGQGSIAIGTNALSGSGTVPDAPNVLAVADTPVAGNNTIAIGTNSTAQGTDSVAVGRGASTGIFTNSVAIGAGAQANANDQIVLGTAAHTVNVPGALNVTGATTLTGALTANGGITTTTFAASGNATVGGTLNVTGVTTLGTLNAGAATLNSAVITNNASVGGNLSVTGDASVGGNLDMTNGQIKNVANGTAAGDAVNFGQLQETRKLLSGGIASSAAMANIPLVDTTKKFAVGVGLGGYDGQSAIAVGGSYRVNPMTVIRGSLAGGSASKTAVGVGVGFSW
jgi:hypothetical protein